MQSIWDILNSIGETISTIWEYIQTIFEWVGMAIDYIIQIINLAYDFIDSFPSWLKAFAIATICICTIYTILGWAGGNSE